MIFENTRNKILTKFKYHFQELIYNSTAIQYNHKFQEIIKDVIYQNLKKVLYKCLEDRKSANKCILIISYKFKQILFNIWKTRYNSFLKWEKHNNINTKIKKRGKYFNKSKDSNKQSYENYIKDQYVDLTNIFMENYIKNDTQIFSLLKFNFSTSVALAR